MWLDGRVDLGVGRQGRRVLELLLTHVAEELLPVRELKMPSPEKITHNANSGSIYSHSSPD